jgi:transposase
MAADENRAHSAAKAPSERTGMFTTGIVSRKAGRDIALFFTGKQHAGENLADVLRRRAAELDTPIQMCDALSRNLPQEFKLILSNCLAHSRRRFTEVVEDFPQECRYVIETLAKVYRFDANAKEQKMSDEERLRFHQEKSAPLMAELDRWLVDQIEGLKMEPNSGLGQAIEYAIKHWEKLTRFLHVAGAPLDNTVVERALKKSILRRKNSLFFKTQNGARVGDIFTSLIYTCQLQGVDPFDYLNELQRHSEELAANPGEWMPWNYKATLGRLRDAAGAMAGKSAGAEASHQSPSPREPQGPRSS